MGTNWQKIEAQWPARIDDTTLPFDTLRRQMESFLASHAVIPKAFSHFGIVIKDIDATLDILAQILQQPWTPAIRNWVSAFSVHVARGEMEGMELEFIQPLGESFFLDFLNTGGERMQHASFRVEAIEDCIENLQVKQVPVIGGGIQVGSHGKIAFIRPEAFYPLCLELCEPYMA